MESAIPPHLKCPRTRDPRASQDYQPPYPAWVARLRPGVSHVGMGYFGVQFRRPQHAATAMQTLHWLRTQFALDGGPGHHDLAHCVDEEGFDTLVAIGYWDDVSSLRRWLEKPLVSQWWDDPARSDEGIGHFREILCPSVTHVETLFSTPDRFEGVAVLAEGRSDEIQEHGYWGSARDRLPAAQTDALRAVGSLAERKSGKRVSVAGHSGLALIRSGQEWSETIGQERELYLQQVEPVLKQGMTFLAEHGPTVGCHSNRYMQHVDSQGKKTEKSFGMSYWKSLEHLERWSESHPTHLAIFGSFMTMVKAMNFDLRLRLYHEVTVADPDQQLFEYVNCHAGTGVLRAIGAG